MTFKRMKPDPVGLRDWAARHLRVGPHEQLRWRARALWLHWCDQAKQAGIEPGTPRSFGRAIAEAAGAIAWQSDEISTGGPRKGKRKRTRYYLGVELTGYRPMLEEADRPSWMDDRQWQHARAQETEWADERYRRGSEVRPIGKRLSAKLKALESSEGADE